MRIKDDEWNVYRRYSQFFDVHKSVSIKRILFVKAKMPWKKSQANSFEIESKFFAPLEMNVNFSLIFFFLLLLFSLFFIFQLRRKFPVVETFKFPPKKRLGNKVS